MIGNLITGKLLGAALVGSLVFTAVMATGAYFKGKKVDRARSDLVIKTMQLDAAERLNAANAKSAALSAKLEANKEKALNDARIERKRQEVRLAAALHAAEQLRGELAAVAGGPGPDKDSIATCRRDASGLGDVLAGALRSHAICTAAAEREALNARTVLAAWPTVINDESR